VERLSRHPARIRYWLPDGRGVAGAWVEVSRIKQAASARPFELMDMKEQLVAAAGAGIPKHFLVGVCNGVPAAQREVSLAWL